MKRLEFTVFLLTTILSCWLMKQKKALTVLPVPLNLFYLTGNGFSFLFNMTF